MIIGLTLLGIVAVCWLGIVAFGPPYVPTLARDLRTLLDGLQLGESDVVVDMGAGDGRVLKAVTRRGAQAVGVELNPFLVWIARYRLRATAAKVVTGDMWRFQLPEVTTYVFVFCAEPFLKKLEAYCRAQVAAGRSFYLVSYGFRLDGLEVDREIGPFAVYRFSPK